MDVIPLVDEGLGNSAYVVDLGDGGALVLDPERDPRPYLVELDRHGLTPRFVVDTHLHADFISGGRELAAAGAQLLAPAGSELAFPHRPLRDGDELGLGGLTLRVIATPGHTPEHLAYLLLDGSRPVALFSGGTLMAGGVARTDLLSPTRPNRSPGRRTGRSTSGCCPCRTLSGFTRRTAAGRSAPPRQAANAQPRSGGSAPRTRCWSAILPRTSSSPGSSGTSAPTRPTSSSCAT